MQINARATYSLSFGGTSPHIFLPDRSNDSSIVEANSLGDKNSNGQFSNKREWTLYLPKAYHPLLLQRHRENLRKAKKGVSHASPVKSLKGTGCAIFYIIFCLVLLLLLLLLLFSLTGCHIWLRSGLFN